MRPSSAPRARWTGSLARAVHVVYYAADPDLFCPIPVQQDVDVFFYGHTREYREEWIDGMITYASQAASRVLGYAPDDLVGQHAATLLHPDDQERVLADLEDMARRARLATTVEFRCRRVEATKPGKLLNQAKGVGKVHVQVVVDVFCSFAFAKVKVSYNPEKDGKLQGFVDKGFDVEKLVSW